MSSIFQRSLAIFGKRAMFTAWVAICPAALIASADADFDPPEGMVFIPGGSFEMGGDPGLMGGGSQSHNTSYPIHEVTLSGFFMDATEVTNAEFAKFVEATGYVTFAERPIAPEIVEQMRQAGRESIRQLGNLLETAAKDKKAAIQASIKRIEAALKVSDAKAGAIVFAPPEGEVHGQFDYTQWWRIKPSANWRQPEGEGSTWVGREDHPVVNVNWEDALAYAQWTGKRLPTEAEWERAARGGLVRQPYAWGDDFAPRGEDVWMANIWQGLWPYENSGEDGFVATSPVKSFPPNAFGLYDIAGNVWEIVADRYHPATYRARAAEAEVVNPTGPSAELLRRAGQPTERFVTRGGSFLCSDSWCRGYQPGSRQVQEIDSPANHTGFRLVKDLPTE